MRRLLTSALILVTVLFVISVTLNFKLASSSAQAYAGELRARLEPLGPSLNLTHAKSGDRRIVLLGDSRAAQWPLTVPGSEVVNLGVPGQTSAQIRLRAATQLPLAKPAVTVIELGVNDLKAIAVMPERRAEIEQRLRENLHAIVNDAKRCGSEVIVCTDFPRGPLGLLDRLRWSPAVDSAIRDFNTHIRTTYPAVFDAANVLSPAGAPVPAEFAQDLLHLNAAGYARLNSALVPRLTR